MQIEPQTTLPILYQLVDPFDSTLYYVRAVVYDSTTGAVITTKNLTSQGNGLYKSTITAPADGSGLGRHIHVIINVYTDSGYTTNSDAYQRQIDKYVVKSSLKFGGGGSGSDIDYDKIRKIFSGIIDAMLVTLTESIKASKTNLKPVLAQIQALQDAIDGIEPATFEEKPTDLSPVLDKLASLESGIKKAIAEKEVTPETKPTDISPILEALSVIKESLTTAHDMTENSKSEIITALDGVKQEISKGREDKKQALREVLGDMITNSQMPAPRKPSPMDRYFP